LNERFYKFRVLWNDESFLLRPLTLQMWVYVIFGRMDKREARNYFLAIVTHFTYDHNYFLAFPARSFV